jgi:SAM-dependent methyltransferase
MSLNIRDYSWGLDERLCPCDVHFMRWVRKTGLKGGAIFHFGTGGHHLVGIECAAPDLDIAVYGITASPLEYEEYVKLVIEKPRIGHTYKAFFGDIYQLDKRMLPAFDAVTLFHLCEFRSEQNEAYGALTDLAVAQVLTDCLKPGGHLLFYTGSQAFEPSLPVIEALLASRPLSRVDDHETLRIYRKD